MEVVAAEPAGDVDDLADEEEAGDGAGLQGAGVEGAGVDSAGGDLGLAEAFGAGGVEPPVVEGVLEGGEVAVRKAGEVAMDEALGEAAGEVGAEAGEDGEGIAAGGLGEDGVEEVGGVGEEVEGDGVAGAPEGGDLKDGRTGEAAVGEEGFFAEGGWAAGGAGSGDDLGGEAGEVAPGDAVGLGEDQGDEGGAGLKDGDVELAGEVVAEAGGAELGDGEAAGGDDEGLAAEVAGGGFEMEAGGVGGSGMGAVDGVNSGGETELGVGGGALALEHGDDPLGGAVAKELAEGLFVEGDVVGADEGDEVVGGVAGEGGAGEVGVGGEEVFVGGSAIGEVAAAAAGDEDFAAGAIIAVEDERSAAAEAGLPGAEEAGCAGAQDDDIGVVHLWLRIEDSAMAMDGGVVGEVRVSRRAAERLRAGHVWVYRTEVEMPVVRERGAVVTVRAGSGAVLGYGLWSTSSTIAVRLLGRGTMGAEGLEALVRERVRAALALRKRLVPVGEETDGRRLIFSEADGLPGVIADQYGSMVVLQLGTQGAARAEVRRAVVEELAAGLAGELTIWERGDARVRAIEELEAPGAEPLFVRGEARSAGEFRMNGLRFAYDAGAGQKTGAFLDQRENYRAAEEWVRRIGGAARGRAMDVCTYQGGFALHLGRACARVTGVDASRAALEVADANLVRNGGLVGAEVDWVEADAFELLRAWAAAGERFGAAVLDPPAFAKSRRSAEDALRGYKELNLRALQILEKDGLLVTCTCSHHVDEEAFRGVVAGAAADAGRTVQILEAKGAGLDHPVVLTLPETRYLKCLICWVR